MKYSEKPFDKKKITGAQIIFSPDGTKLAMQLWSLDSGKTWEFWILPFPKGEPKQLKKFSFDGFYGFSWTPDSKHLIASTDHPFKRKHHLCLIDLEREKLRPITFGVNNEMSPAVSSDGKRIAFASGNMQFDLIEVPLNGERMRNLTSTPLNEKAPAWSRKEINLLMYRIEMELMSSGFEAKLKGGNVLWLQKKIFPNESILSFSRPVFSADGLRIAYHVNTSTNTQIWISSLAGGSPIRLFNEPMDNSRLRGPAMGIGLRICVKLTAI